MNPITNGEPLTDAGRERLHRIRRAIADGTYQVSSYDVALKLIHSMFEFGDLPSLQRPSSPSEDEVEVQRLDQKSS